MRFRTVASLFLLSLVAGAALHSVDYSSEPAPTPEEKYNVVLISVDTLRSDHVSCYGYSRNITPNMCGYGDPVIFENAYSQAPWSLTSYVSLLTGEWPFNHGITTAERVSKDKILLSEMLKSRGYSTGGFVDGGMLSYWSRLYQGFDPYVSTRNEGGDVGHNEKIFGSGFRYLNQTERSTFLMLHSMEVHEPYRPENRTIFKNFAPDNLDSSINITDDELGARSNYSEMNLSEREIEYLKAGYDTSIKRTDREIGEFFRKLNRSGAWDNTIIILTSDHGETFQGHSSQVGHSIDLHQEYIKVPLIIYHPDYEGRRIEERVRLIDVLPTVLDFLDYDLEKEVDGRSLQPLIEGDGTEDRPVYSSTTQYLSKDNKSSLIKNDLKIIWNRNTGETELFNLSSDPGERYDISSSNREKVRAMKAALRELANSQEKNKTSTDAEIKERLRELGYR